MESSILSVVVTDLENVLSVSFVIKYMIVLSVNCL